MQATTVRGVVVVAFARLAGWWNSWNGAAQTPADMKFTDAFERELCDREMRRW
jgi:hypothetical protein